MPPLRTPPGSRRVPNSRGHCVKNFCARWAILCYIFYVLSLLVIKSLSQFGGSYMFILFKSHKCKLRAQDCSMANKTTVFGTSPRGRLRDARIHKNSRSSCSAQTAQKKFESQLSPITGINILDNE